MRLTTIGCSAFKGSSFEEPLAPLTVIFGENWSGKTTRLELIQLLLLGHLPGLDKTAAGIFGLSSGREMSVWGTTDTGLTIRRTWTAKGDSVKAAHELPPELEGQDLLIALNALAYFGMSDRDRTTYVFEHLPMPEGLDVLKLATRARSKIEVNGDDQKRIADLFTSRIIEPPDGEKENPQEFISRVILACQAKAKQAKATVDEMQKTITGLSHLKAADAQGLTHNLEDLDNQLVNKRHALGLLGEAKGAFDQQYQAMVRGRSRRKEIAHELLQFAPDHTAVAEQRKLLTAIAQAIDQLPPQLETPDLAAKRKLQTSLTAEVQDLRSRYTEAGSQLTALKAESAAIEQQTACPYCGAAGNGWRTLREAELAGKIEQLTLRRAALADDGAREKQRLNAVDLEIRLIDKQEVDRTQLLDRQAKVQQEIHRLERKLARVDILNQELAGLTPEDPALEQKAQELQTTINVANETITSLEKVRREAQGRSQELKRLAEAEAERDTSAAELAVAKQGEKAWREIQGEMVEQAFAPLIERANLLFGHLMATPLAFKDGEVGTWKAGVFAGHRTMSGGEKALSYAAIQMALATMAPFRIALFDELGKFSSRNLRRVLQAAKQAVAQGQIDQWIGIDVEREEIYEEAQDSTFLLRKIVSPSPCI